MSGSNQENASNFVGIRPSEAEKFRRNLSALREQIIVAWHERGVLLSREEQAELHADIKETCEFLSELTQHP